MTESRQAALAGTFVFLVIFALMLLAALAMASPPPPAPSTATPGAVQGIMSSPDLQVTHLIECVHRTLDALEESGSGPLWEGGGARCTVHTSSLDLPWVWEEYPEWRYAYLIDVASPRRPVGTNPVCEQLAGGPYPVADEGLSKTP